MRWLTTAVACSGSALTFTPLAEEDGSYEWGTGRKESRRQPMDNVDCLGGHQAAEVVL
jgi:hypothetical protein